MGCSIGILKTTSANWLPKEYMLLTTIYPYCLWSIVAKAAELWLVGANFAFGHKLLGD